MYLKCFAGRKKPFKCSVQRSLLKYEFLSRSTQQISKYEIFSLKVAMLKYAAKKLLGRAFSFSKRRKAVLRARTGTKMYLSYDCLRQNDLMFAFPETRTPFFSSPSVL